MRVEVTDAWAHAVQVAGCVVRPLVLTFSHTSLPPEAALRSQDDSRQVSHDIPDMSLLPVTGLRQMHRRTAAALGSLLLVLLCPASVPAQRALIAPQPGLGRLTVAAATPAELRSWDGTIDQFVQRGELVMRSMREDPVLAGHRHETFIQSLLGYSGLRRQPRPPDGGRGDGVCDRHVVDGHHHQPDPRPVRGPRGGDPGGGHGRVPSWPPVRRT